MNKRVKVAYIAGFVDGEGCFSISKHGSGSYSCRVIITNRDLKPLNLINKIFRGTISKVKNKNPKHGQAFKLDISGYEKIKTFISVVQPYLVSKKAQANLMLKYIQSRDNLSKKLGYKGLNQHTPINYNQKKLLKKLQEEKKKTSMRASII